MRRVLFFALCALATSMAAGGLGVYAQGGATNVAMAVTGPFWADPCNAPVNVSSDGTKRVFGAIDARSTVYYRVTYSGYTDPLAVTLAKGNVHVTANSCHYGDVTVAASTEPPEAGKTVILVSITGIYADDETEGTIDISIDEGTATDADGLTAVGYTAATGSATVFTVDHKRPVPTVSVAPWVADAENRLDFDPSLGTDPGIVQFVVTFNEDVLVKSFTGITILPGIGALAAPDVTPRDVVGLWEDDAGHSQADSIFSTHFPDGYCYYREDDVVATDGDGKFARSFLVTVRPRRDSTVSIRVRANAVEDISGSPCVDRPSGTYAPHGNLCQQSEESPSVQVNDAPRIYLALQQPYALDVLSPATAAPPAEPMYAPHSSTPTLVWKLEFSEPVDDFGTGDVSVNSTSTDPAAAGGTKTVVVTGTQAPGEGGSVYNIGVSGMTYAGTVEVSVGVGAATRQLPQEWFRHSPGWLQPNWGSGGPCDLPTAYWDGSAPDRLTMVLPSGLPQPPAYAGTYDTANPVIDAAGTAHDDVEVRNVTWSNDRGGSGECLTSDIVASVVGPSISSTTTGPVTYTVRYSDLTVQDQYSTDVSDPSIDFKKTIPDNYVGGVDSVLNVVGPTGVIDDINVVLDIAHTYDEDLTVSLISPSGTEVRLLRGVGGDGDGFTGTLIDDEAATAIGDGTAPFSAAGGYKPLESLSTFDGEPLNGVWKLHVVDPTFEDEGEILGWHLQFMVANDITLSDSDITLNTTGTATGTVAVSGTDASSRTVTISGISGTGTLGISVAGATAYKGTTGGRFYALPVGPSQTFAVGTAGTGIAISEPSLWISPTPGATPTDAAITDVSYTITYTGATSITLKPSDITLNKTGSANGAVSVTGSDLTSRTVTVRGISGSGTIGISIASGTATGLAGAAPAVGPSATFDVGTRTVSWRTYSLPLKPGKNVVTFTAEDATAAMSLTGGRLPYVLTVNCSNDFLGDFVDEDAGEYTSIALDPSGNPRISYFDFTNRDLKYAAWDGQAWDVESVDGSLPPPAQFQNVGQYSSLKLDSAGNPHISYYDATNGDLRYAYWKNMQWHRETVDGTAGTADDEGLFTSLALSSSGYPRIAYYDANATRLRYAAWNGTAWVKSDVDTGYDVGQYASLALDASGLPRIAYYDATHKDLKYAVGSDAVNPVWTVMSVDESADDAGQFASLALDSDGLPRIAYYDVTTSSLMYIEGDDPAVPTWSAPTTIDTIGSAPGKQYVSLKLHGLTDLGVLRNPVDPLNNLPRIAYYDSVNGDLKYAEYSPTGTPQWTLSTLDDGKAEAGVNTFDVGQYCSMVLDSSGNAHVSYYDASNQRLKYVYRSSGPRCVVTGPAGPTNMSPINFTITFASAVTGLDVSNITVTGGVKNSLTQIAPDDGTTYLLVVSPTGDGTVTCTVPAGVARAGTIDNLASNTASVIYDGTRPTVTIDQDYIGEDPTGLQPIYFSVVFSEPVADFTGDDITISGSAGGVKTATIDGYGNYYNVAVSGMTTAGTVMVSIAADKAHDAAGNGNTASTSTDNTVWYDGTPLTVTINQAEGQKDPTNSSTINFVAEFSEPITDWACFTFMGDWTHNSGPCPPFSNIEWVLSFTGNAKFYDNDGVDTRTAVITPIGTADQFGHYKKFNVAVSGMTTDGSVIVSVPAGAAFDCDSSGSPINFSLASTSSDNKVVYDSTPPGASINRKSDQLAITSGQPIRFTVVFTESVTGFDATDVDITGTADLSNITKVVTGSGTTYTVEVGGVAIPAGQTAPVTVIANVAPGKCTDAAGNGNTRANSQNNGNVVEFDDRGPTVTVEQAVDQLDSSADDPIHFTATFSEPVTDFTASDITLGGTVGYVGTPSVTITDISGNNRTTFDIAVGGFDSAEPGSVTVEIDEGVAHDALGNANTAATSADNKVVYFPDQCSTTHVAIPDNDPTGAESTIDLTGYSGTIMDLNVSLSVSHAYDQDLSAYLIGPDGTTITLFANVGGNGANFTDTVLDDEAALALPTSGVRAPFTGSWKPAGLLSSYDGKDLSGIWKIRLVDNHGQVQGTLLKWCLQFLIQDSVAPVCTVTSPELVTNNTPIDFTIRFSEQVSELSADSITVVNGAKGTLGKAGADYTLPVTPAGNGPVSVTVAAGSVHDTCGNFNAEASYSVTYDAVAPTVTLLAVTASPTNSSTVTFTAAFSEPVYDFTRDGVVVATGTGMAFETGGTAPNVTVTDSGNHQTYTIAVSGMTTTGLVSAKVAANAAHDLAGNYNTSASNQPAVSFVGVICNVSGPSSPTRTTPVTFTLTFSTAVSGLAKSAIVVTGGTKVTLSPEGTGVSALKYDLTVSPTGDGTVTCQVPANAAKDASGNSNSPSNVASVVYDGTRVEATINQAEAQVDPTSALPVTFAAVFSEAVTDFGASDVVITGSAGGTKTTTITDSGDHKTYTVSISGVTDGTVIANIPADAVHDAAGNGNNVARFTDNTIVYDATRPTVTVKQFQGRGTAAAQSDPTASLPIKFTAEFSESVTGFTSADVVVGGTAPGVKTVTIEQISQRTYDISVSGVSGSGTVSASVPESAAQDGAGNQSTASTSTDNTVTYDVGQLTVSIDKASGQSDPTSSLPINFTVMFNKPVTDFTSADVDITGTFAGTPNKTVTDSGDHMKYNVAVGNITCQTGSTLPVTVIASIKAGQAHDSADNANQASTSTDNEVTFDNRGPSVVVVQDPDQPDSSLKADGKDTIKFLATFSEPVSDFTADDLTIAGSAGYIDSPVKSVTDTGDKMTYTILVSGIDEAKPGSVVVSIAKDKAHDDLANGNTASTGTNNSVVFFPTQCSDDVPKSIPDNDPTGVESVLDMTGYSGVISDVNVTLNISHGYDQDLTVKLISPAGTEALLFSGVGGSGSGFAATLIDDQALTAITAGEAPFTDINGYQPEEALSKFKGENITGEWKLLVVDSSSGNTGTLNSWCLQLTISDTTVPVCSITAPASPTNTSPVNFVITFSEPVVGFEASQATVTGGTRGTLTGSGASYVLPVTPSGDGVVSCQIAAGVVHDTCGNYNADVSTASVTYQGTPPSVTINQASGQADPTNSSPIVYTVVFSEAVTGFGTGDVEVSGTAFGAGATKTQTVTGSGTTYTVAVSGMTQSGTVIATIPAGACTDMTSNPNLASTSTDNTVTYDVTKPTVTVNQASSQADPTTSQTISFRAVFSKPVSGFTNADVTIGGTAGGSKTCTVTDSGDHQTYTIVVSLASGATSGSVIASVGANVAQDSLGNGNAASTSTDNTVWYDNGQAPTVTVNQAADQSDPANTAPVTFDVVFSKPVDDFTAADVTLDTSSVDTLTIEATPDDGQAHADYTVSVTGMTEPQTLTLTVAADVAHDSFARGNTASTSTDNEVTFDNVKPTVTINQAASQADPTASTTVDFTATFSEPVTGFTYEDVQVTGTAFGSGATKTVAVTQTGDLTYNVAVSGMTTTGSVFATIPAGIAFDAAGNSNSASSSTDNSVTYDTPPTVTIQTATAQADPTNASPINFKVVFSESVVGFVTGRVALSGTAFGTGTAVGTVTGSGAVYNVAVSGMTQSGTVIATVPAGAAKDLGGNGNYAASGSVTVQYDITKPTVTVNQSATQVDPTSAAPVVFSIVFSKAVVDFTSDDVTIAGTATGTRTVTLAGSGTTFTASVSDITGSGTVIASIAAGKVHDAVGNGNLASTSTDNTVTYDVSGPTVTVNQDAGQSDPTKELPIKFTVVFSKPVTDFTSEDVTVTNAAGGTPTVTVTQSGTANTTYSVAVAGLASTGTVKVSVAANKAHDSLGNGNLASTSTDNTVTYDNAGPSVTVTRAAGQVTPTRQSPINFTVTFSKAVTGFESEDVTLGGTAAATTAVVTGSGTTYNVAVSGMAGTGAVTVTIAKDVANDSAGNGNVASTGTENTVTYDETSPTVIITGPTADDSCTRNTSALTISGSAEDSVGIQKVEWKTAKGASGTCTGTTSWSAQDIQITGGQDTVTVTATDTSGNTTTDSLIVRVIDASPGTTWSGYSMIGLPIIPDYTDALDEVGFRTDVVGSTTRYYWTMWDAAAGEYKTYPGSETNFEPAESTPGRGFWAAFKGTPATPPGVVPAQDQAVTVHLYAGWNLVGQPFASPLTWDLTAIKVKYSGQTATLADARDLGWIKDYAWGWAPDTTSTSGGSYYLVADPTIIAGSTNVMAPWCAYWLKANVACDVVLPAP